MEKTEQPVQQNNHFTGTFRRARKKKAVDSKPIQDNLKSLNLSENLVKNDAVALGSMGFVIKENGQVESNDRRNKMTKYIAMDCEMVGIGSDGSEHMLAGFLW
ncbi:hypothetical protein EVAR_86821_1 [Eumeta japonica]|uniref:RNA exonuclease 4 n=1 Tax=Eumeta variegata TaxID=151549 RepID=A0A4C1VT31_EUMVA|nr:hypothetical protein EVAR_86821_1 [Eumeta japonica]